MFDICAIISEYNPFHEGHRYHIEESRKKTGAKYVAAIMSGDFVQRGEPALFPKLERARAAISGGADIVIELPVEYACSNAENFAFGGVRIAAAIGASYLSFGSESGDIELLKSISESILEEDEAFKSSLKNKLGGGMSFAAARAEANDMLAELPPNDILACEYIKAIEKLGVGLKPVPILRKGASHDEIDISAPRSALAIRESLKSGKSDYINEAFCGLKPIFTNDFSAVMLYRLRSMSISELSEIAEIGEGLEYRIKTAAEKARNYEELLSLSKSKRYTAARLKRIFMNAILGITKEKRSLANEKAPELRVLAVKNEARELLSLISKKAKLLINKDGESPNESVLASNCYASVAALPAYRDYTEKIVVYNSCSK